MKSESLQTPPRRGSITQGYIPTADIIRKSISRSWTISNPEDDQQINSKNGIDPRIHVPTLGSSIHHQETNSYPNLIRLNKSPYNSNMDFNADSYERTPPTQRRVLRQSTLPNPDSSYPSNSLKIPVSPKQQVSPQYSPYHTDNENEPENDAPQPPSIRYQIRRQSTLPCKPNEHHTSKYLSTSPNRSYSRSPDPSSLDGEHSPRYPPFVRQSTFPSNNGAEQFHQRQLPTSPNRLSYSKSPDSGGENGQVSPRRFTRQTTLPNPDQHIKLLPTSPPKKSPQYMKRSPEFQRQHTISNPEGMSTLSVHQHGPKFLPISPRQKQSFLFPQPSAPRTFLSQQHFPTMNEDQPPPTNHPIREHSKMIKVRSHSNEEYSFNKSHVPPPTEGRRLLPEIPNRSRSPSRLVRQDHVKDENGEKRSPILKTFAEAKQALVEEYDGQMYETQYTTEYCELNSTFAEADENNYNEQESYNAYEQGMQMDQSSSGLLYYAAEQTTQFHEPDVRRYDSVRNKITSSVKSAESYMNDSSSDYYTPDEYIRQAQKNRNRRRKSRELPADPEVVITLPVDESRKHKPETMRSVSEDSSPRTMKIVPRRSFSQPEKETQKKPEPSKIPSPKALGEKTKPTSPVKVEADTGPRKPVYKFPKMLEMRGDSKSFDAVVRQLIKTDDGKDADDKSQSMDDNLFSEKKEHKTTLNEAEIQNAVEQAAGLFKKVVLQRRKERKPADEGDMAGRREDVSESELKYSTDVEDYKLVFISSDSSGKEDDYDDSSSTTSSIATKCSIILDECDWDYFEPSAQNTKSLLKDFASSTFSPFGSPSLYRRRFNPSPASSPLFYRRGQSESPLSIRKSDEEILNSSSPTSSEGFLPEYLKAWKQNHKCKDVSHACKCGQSPHYVAIPVPILVPMDEFRNWNSSGNNSDLLQLWNSSSNLLLNQHEANVDVIDAQHSDDLVKTLPDGEEKEKKKQKISDLSITSNNVSLCSSVFPSRRISRSLSLDSDSFDNERDNSGAHLIHKSSDLKARKSELRSTTHLSETIKITSKHETNTCGSVVSVGSPYTSDNLIKTTASCNPNAIQATSYSGTMISVGKLKAPESGASDGHLVSESVFSSADEESDEEKSVQRSYDVAGASLVASDVESTSSNREEETSGTDVTDSEDTGVDDLRSKSKRFTKVFVVNRNAPTSESDSCSSINVVESSSDDETSSDNDTDTDGITLNYMKLLEQEENNPSSQSSQEVVVLNSIKPIDEDIIESVILSSIKTIDNDFDDITNAYSEKVNENVCVDKNKSKSPSISDDDSKLTNVSEKIKTNEQTSICEDKQSITCDSSAKTSQTELDANSNETLTDGDDDEFQVDSMDFIQEKKTSSCNLSMILNERTLHDDVSSADDEKLLEIESPLNGDVDDKREQQTLIVNNDNVPAKETGLHQHITTDDVLPLLNDQSATSAGNNNTINISCMKQSVNEEKAQEQTASVSSQRSNQADGNGKFTSLIMITQDQDEDNFAMKSSSNVNVVSSDTTQIVTANSSRDAIVVQHRNWQPRYPTNVTNGASVKSKIGFYEENINKNSNSKAKVEPSSSDENKSKADEVLIEKSEDSMANKSENDDVKVITSNDTLSAVVCMEDGLADDDSWVEDISQQDSEEFASSDFDSSDEMTLTANDREEELRGYNRVSIDFTLHTIVEESCEESEYEAGDRKSQRMSASELEKYFFFGLGDGNAHSSPAKTQDDSPSETSSVCSEGLDSLNGPDETTKTGDETLASSRLEKYFLSGFMGFSADGADGSDGSGSVGSDSEGRPSPEQRRKKLVRARGTGRSHSSSLDNLLSKEESSLDNQNDLNQQESGDSSETDTCDDPTEKTENHSDTVKRKKKCKKLDTDDSRKIPDVEVKDPSESENDEDGRKTPQPEFLMPASSNLVQSRKQHSRDSGFIGSNDDLLKSDGQKSPDMKVELEEIQEEMKESEPTVSDKTPALKTNLMRKDSFNAWSSDEETNLMMSKMRQFFKSLVAASANSRNPKSSTSTEATSVGVQKARQRPPQLVYFENELTRLMKTVPGIKEEQVRELVEYFSSEDTWSDSYDSSDYTSSDKESAVRKSTKIQQQISASCQEIIQKFDKGKAVIPDEEGDMGDGGLLDDGLNKETAFVYQKLVASITKIADEKPVVAPIETANSPPIIAKVMHHIGSRLVALMHEVSSGESLKSNSPKQATRYHRRLQAKISATTTEDDDSESNFEDPLTHNLPRSKSHDLLLGDAKPTPDAMTGEEREASDYERFSWRGSFESALLTNCDSRNKLSTLDNSSSAHSILAAKRRSAGDLLFTPKSLSREQLDRVRSCGSIGGAGEHDLENSKLWESTQSQESTRRRSGIIEDDTDESSDNEHHLHARTTLPRSIQTSSIVASTTNSLPRLPTTSSNTQTTSGAMQKAQSVYQFLQNNVKSARYRAPGFNRQQQAPKRALSAPGLQPLVPRRDRRNKVHSLAMEETHLSDNASSPVIGNRNVAATTLVPSSAASHPASPASTTTDPWPSQSDEDIDRLVAMHQNRHNSLSSLGLRSDSMASVYSGAGEGRYGTVQVKGSVEFGMQYNYKQGALEIHVKQCKELAAVDLKRNRSDPYVKVYLLPDKTKSGKRKTKVKKHTLNPVFDEVLRFYMSLSSLESRTLWLTVWHSDMFGRNDFLGEVMISLQNKVFDNPQPQWYPLEERSEPFEDVTTYRGDIIVGLKFIPGSDSSGSSHSHGLSLRKFSIKSNSSATSANNGSPTGPISCSKNTKGSLHIMVKEAKHLSAVKANGNCDAFCKSYLLPDKNRSSKQKTPVAKRTTSPQWNYTFVYEDVTLAELSERALELTIWDHDRLASNEFLGGVRFSLGTGKHYGRIAEWNDANGKELTLWQSMINRPNFWVEGCLALRSTLEHRLCS